MHKEQYFITKWERIRQQGKTRYILIRGVLGYGLLYFLAFVFLVPYIDNNYTLSFLNTDSFRTKLMIFTPLSFIVGYLIGLAGWKGNEKRYHAIVKR